MTIISEFLNPIIRGWLNYFQAYCRSNVKQSMDWLNRKLVKWAMKKYKQFRGHPKRAMKWLKQVAERDRNLFVHWQQGWLP